MTERSTTHATFTMERTYKASPAHVFAHWADPALKTKWFGAPGDPSMQYSMDFRIGGYERSAGTAPNGLHYAYEARYDDIVPEERLVYVYTMDMDGIRISSSLGTLELKASGTGTRLTYTEQGVYLDGHDTRESREGGTAELLDALGRVLEDDDA